MSVIKQSVLPLFNSSLPLLSRGCLAYSSLCCTWTCLSTGSCASPVHTYSSSVLHLEVSRAFVRLEGVRLQEPKLRLYVYFSTAPEGCLSTRACAAHVRVYLQELKPIAYCVLGLFICLFPASSSLQNRYNISSILLLLLYSQFYKPQAILALPHL
jgi:hypothetical protein